MDRAIEACCKQEWSPDKEAGSDTFLTVMMMTIMMMGSLFMCILIVVIIISLSRVSRVAYLSETGVDYTAGASVGADDLVPCFGGGCGVGQLRCATENRCQLCGIRYTYIYMYIL